MTEIQSQWDMDMIKWLRLNRIPDKYHKDSLRNYGTFGNELCDFLDDTEIRKASFADKPLINFYSTDMGLTAEDYMILVLRSMAMRKYTTAMMGLGMFLRKTEELYDEFAEKDFLGFPGFYRSSLSHDSRAKEREDFIDEFVGEFIRDGGVVFIVSDCPICEFPFYSDFVTFFTRFGRDINCDSRN